MSFPLADINETLVSKEFFKLSSSTLILSESYGGKPFSVVLIRMERFKLLPEKVKRMVLSSLNHWCASGFMLKAQCFML